MAVANQRKTASLPPAEDAPYNAPGHMFTVWWFRITSHINLRTACRSKSTSRFPILQSFRVLRIPSTLQTSDLFIELLNFKFQAVCFLQSRSGH